MMYKLPPNASLLQVAMVCGSIECLKFILEQMRQSEAVHQQMLMENKLNQGPMHLVQFVTSGPVLYLLQENIDLFQPCFQALHNNPVVDVIRGKNLAACEFFANSVPLDLLEEIAPLRVIEHETALLSNVQYLKQLQEMRAYFSEYSMSRANSSVQQNYVPIQREDSFVIGPTGDPCAVSQQLTASSRSVTPQESRQQSAELPKIPTLEDESDEVMLPLLGVKVQK